VEFFTSEKQWETILEKIKGDPYISFYAGNSEVSARLSGAHDRADLRRIWTRMLRIR
jgi:hypothetical protein